jgi:PilZ domain
MMYSNDSELTEKFTAALHVLGIQNEPVVEFDRAVKRLYDHFDAVLVDCVDPTALELVKAVRASHANARSIVFAISDFQNARCIGSLANFQIPKPVNWDVTKRTLRAARTLIHRERRLNERIQMRSSALILVDSKEVAVRVMDLSLRGMLVQWTGRLELNRRLMVRFNLPDTKIAVHCKGRVAWNDDKGQTGIEFLNVPNDVVAQMEQWLTKNRHGHKLAAAAVARSNSW